MGHGFAQIFAQHGFDVYLTDQTTELAERGKQMIVTNFETMIAEALITRGDANASLERIHIIGSLEEAVTNADFVLEAVLEDINVKLGVWKQLNDLARNEAILASNTSSFDINELAAVVDRADRVIGTHWFNPPQIVPCVEVIPADATSQRVVDTIVRLLESIGKVPAITKSMPGFVANRIQLVMAAEAFRCLEEGVATAEDIDKIVKNSFGFRLGAYGPFQIADLAGLDTYKGVYDYLYAKYGKEWYRAPETVRALVEQGRVGVKAGAGVYDYSEEEARRVRAERDQKLYAMLRAHEAKEREGEPARSASR
jgi:3-hydroxybutyryl-CoA dehydrogenase